jgi:uncharacterized SAM-binding protein YcdF (DUF218 family)
MTRQIILFIIKCLILALILTTGCIAARQMEPVSDDKAADMQNSLDDFIPILQKQLDEIFVLTNRTAGNLTGTDTRTPTECLPYGRSSLWQGQEGD